MDKEQQNLVGMGFGIGIGFSILVFLIYKWFSLSDTVFIIFGVFALFVIIILTLWDYEKFKKEETGPKY